MLTSSFSYTKAYPDVFTQKASMGWRPASTCRVVVSLLLPGSLEVENWLLHVAYSNDHAVGALAPFFCNSIVLMQSRGNGFANRSIVLRSYGTLSKYIGVKCGQMCGMNQCRCSNKLSCPGRQSSMVRFGTRSWNPGKVLTDDRPSVGGSNILVATGHLWQLLWIFSTWTIL